MKFTYSLLIVMVMSLLACQNDSKENASSDNAQTSAVQKPVNSGTVPVRPSAPKNVVNNQSTAKVNWMSIEEAVKANEKNPKPILVDVYTDWCGWCKVMDRKTFTNPEVQAFIEENFHAVKFNAEQRDPVEFNGKTYEFVPGGRRGHNRLAAYLLNGRLGYPSFAFLNSDYEHLQITVGYKNPDQFMAEMKKAISKNM
ncbi:MAG: thioredoxin family protein [Saprospiraceae bacterium]|nr:thioredoxin family protein [Saprospiraceae bacterium]